MKPREKGHRLPVTLNINKIWQVADEFRQF